MYMLHFSQHLEEEELNANKMPKLLLKPIKADKLLDLEKEGLAESMVGGAKKRRGRPKKIKDTRGSKGRYRQKKSNLQVLLQEVFAGTGPKEPKKDKMMEFLLMSQPSLTKIEDNLSVIL